MTDDDGVQSAWGIRGDGEVRPLGSGAEARREFFESAVQPNLMPDEINLHLVPHPDNDPTRQAFSEEGFESLGYQFHDFVMARTLAYYNRTGRFPAGLRAEVKISWDDPRRADELDRDSEEPWYQLDDQGATEIPLDGSHRFRPFLDDRKLP